MMAMDSYQNGAVTDTEFQRLAQTIGTNIQKILQNVSSIQRMIAQIGTPQDNQQFQQQLHQIQHYTGQLAKDTSKHLKDLNNFSGEQRQWRLQKERLHNDFTKALNSFQAAQRTAAQREKEVIKRAKAASGINALAAPGAQGNLIDVEEGSLGNDTTMGQSKTQMLLEEEANIEQLQEREKSIRQLESDIVDVNTIFKDLATMVHEQGEMVDSIEANVESTSVRVHEGTEQLRQAETYKNQSRRRKYYLICGLLALFAFFCFIIWLGF
ncbi:syntaxin-12-like isoform X2 [Tigriopus californicus]|uniref:syntaxin-12-like isoform X2 n=1 Tax=Tigriopus californicus TaxID=6832 RepID=UPI0027DA3DEE|nr:syntaxin-12-like isoform X2 [Tigriopus californicus]